MNAVEIEEAISRLAEQPFDAAEFPYAFLEAFGNKATTINRLRKRDSNKTDIEGAVLQHNNIHMAVSPVGEVLKTLERLKNSPATTRQKAKYILATDGEDFQAEDISSGDAIACEYKDFPNHFGFFLPLAGISYTKEIKEVEMDMKATNRLNRLYMELLKDNPQWGAPDRRHDMNHFMARLIFCFFAEDTDIFNGNGLFTATIQKMSTPDSSNTHEVISEIFRSMNTKPQDRAKEKIRSWADVFPYVNGGLFSGSTEVPCFKKIARTYLIKVGELEWKEINPDIFGSMIQAVAEDEERGSLGMHYTSVPNILKVLNPLFLEDLRTKLEEAGDNPRMLLNLRKRMAKIRVFDPACGSGNFLVIAYKQMRKIEAEINKRRGEEHLRTEIPLTNFRGVELKDFPAEVARLALIIAEYQCDVLYRGQKEALAEFLPLDAMNWITCGNALRLDWLSLMDAKGTGVKLLGDDLFSTPLDQAQIDFENEGGETYICGNPPYKGARKQEPNEKSDLKLVYSEHPDYKDADYVTGWLIKASEYCRVTDAKFALVTTSSVCQGEQAQFIWPRIWKNEQEMFFAYSPFKWSNNAANNAGVFVVIIGIRTKSSESKYIYDDTQKRCVSNISPYITDGRNTVVETANSPLSPNFAKMIMGNMARDDGNLILSADEARALIQNHPESRNFLLPLLGTKEIVTGTFRFAVHLKDSDKSMWSQIPPIMERVESVKNFRIKSKAKTTNGYASVPHRFAQYCHKNEMAIALPSVTPEERSYVTPLLLPAGYMVTNLAYLIYGAGVETFALLSSRMHYVWIRAVSGRLGDGIRYTPTISYHTFPIPPLTEKNKADLNRCAEDILLAREAHFPASIAELYEVKEGISQMPENLRHAHERNDEVLERIYIGRRFKNDTERLEKLFDLYTKMTAKPTVADEIKKRAAK